MVLDFVHAEGSGEETTFTLSGGEFSLVTILAKGISVEDVI